jgi:hypothetical protein
VVKGNPVPFVSVTEVGVPKTGAVKVKPAIVAAVAPKATEVEPIVTLELVSFALAIDPASIVLVTVPVSPEVIMLPVLAGTLFVKVEAVLGPDKLT